MIEEPAWPIAAALIGRVEKLVGEWELVISTEPAKNIPSGTGYIWEIEGSCRNPEQGGWRRGILIQKPTFYEALKELTKIVDGP